ncbi:MAG TPA: hypothetical protein VIU11_16785 [Nakamurella sp.]
MSLNRSALPAFLSGVVNAPYRYWPREDDIDSLLGERRSDLEDGRVPRPPWPSWPDPQGQLS